MTMDELKCIRTSWIPLIEVEELCIDETIELSHGDFSWQWISHGETSEYAETPIGTLSYLIPHYGSVIDNSW